MDKFIKWLLKAKIKIAIWATPLVLLFYFDERIHLRDRVYYFFIAFFKSVPLLLLYAYFSTDREQNAIFYASIGMVLLLDMLAGAWYHFKKGDFDFVDLFKGTITKMLLVAIAFISLSILNIPLSRTDVGRAFEITIQMISLLYPVKDIVKNLFVLSNGKFPPEFFMKALYNYEKSGKLREFYEKVSNGITPNELNNNKTDEQQ
ncbi:hypothetical protein [uncultured Capnocytophaga sp.]|jgi:hypothetical protein|nr:hypothetical protein [uncultured Capnocytophaga sp.]